MNYSKKMLLKYLDYCQKYFKSKGVDFLSEYPSFSTFIDEVDTKFLLTPFGKQNLQWGADEMRLILEFIYSFLSENITRGNNTEEDLYVPKRRTYNVEHKVKKVRRIYDTYEQELESFLEPGDVDEDYVNTIEISAWFQVYDGDVIDSYEDTDHNYDSNFYDIYEI